ncbi:cucumber peeling cupredoxin-like [Senna tora]|uniref:Cucumber peeling cupredoxin-like n=1 Tax=Senna tora TaxID=362788 RepID=A0A834XBS1_9FABA|nr:cucumber peeling cupredoxin-like [Senna tora]
MGGLKLPNLTILVVASALALYSIEAADVTVGGNTGWTNALPNASFYSDWASTLSFTTNDTLVFNFVAGGHDVAILSTKADYDNCSVDSAIQTISTSPARVPLNRTGAFYFACAFPGHCNGGQKLTVNVTSSSGGSPPSGSPTTPPSGENSATSLAATLSLLLATVAVNLMF